MKVEEQTTNPVANWYAPGVQDKTNADGQSRTAQIPPLDTIAPTPRSLAEKSGQHLTDAETTLKMADGNPRQVVDAHKSARGDIQRAVNLTSAARRDDAFGRVIATQMAKADIAHGNLNQLCDEIETRLSTARELQMAKQLMQKYAQEGAEEIDLDTPKTEAEEKDFSLMKRLWPICQREGVLLPESWNNIKRDDLKRYAGAVADAISVIGDQRQKDMLEYKRLMNQAQESWELVIATVLKQNQIIMSAIRAIRGQ